MSELNERGITHGNINPANIFITADGIYKITNFGMKEEEGGHTNNRIFVNGAFFDDLKYIAPELMKLKINGNIEREMNYNVCDVYSLGLTILRMMTKKGEKWWNTPSGYLERMISDLVDQTVSMPKFNLLIKNMLTTDHQKRPKFKKLVIFLNQEEFTFGSLS